MKTLLALMLTILLVDAAVAAEGRKYAAMSLLGDRMEIVTAHMQTGSLIDTNSRETVTLPDASIDRFVLRNINRIVADGNPANRVTMVVASDPSLYAAQEKMLDSDAGPDTLLSAVKAAATAQNATHLILVTKYRHDALLRELHKSVGKGHLTGIGYYLNNGGGGRRGRGFGFIAPYAYFRISIVDLATMKVLKEDTCLGSAVRGAGRTGEVVTPWESMNDEAKVRLLQMTIRRELDRVLPALLAE